ncbi:TetR family transcriptional regulator [Kibdelosporangium lantanae]
MTTLRERKREQLTATIADVAIKLFLEHGFDAVSTAAVASAAEVSKPTLFKYFPTKEDLVLHRFADHQDEPARVVRARRPGQSPLAALHQHFLAGLAARDPITGLNDHPDVIGVHRMFETVTSLTARAMTYAARSAEALAAELPLPEGTALVAAHQVVVTLRVLADRNLRELAGGRTIEDVHSEAVVAADQAFTMLRTGIDVSFMD